VRASTNQALRLARISSSSPLSSGRAAVVFHGSFRHNIRGAKHRKKVCFDPTPPGILTMPLFPCVASKFEKI